MDTAYDASEIHAFYKALDYVPIIDNNPRRAEKLEFDPAKKSDKKRKDISRKSQFRT